jgi:hypothetical protein
VTAVAAVTPGTASLRTPVVRAQNPPGATRCTLSTRAAHAAEAAVAATATIPLVDHVVFYRRNADGRDSEYNEDGKRATTGVAALTGSATAAATAAAATASADVATTIQAHQVGGFDTTSCTTTATTTTVVAAHAIETVTSDPFSRYYIAIAGRAACAETAMGSADAVQAVPGVH